MTKNELAELTLRVDECKECGNLFIMNYHTERYCSDRCRVDRTRKNGKISGRKYTEKMSKLRQLYPPEKKQKAVRKKVPQGGRPHRSLSAKIGQVADDLRTLTESHVKFLEKYTKGRKYKRDLAVLNVDIEQLRYRLTRLTMHFPALATELGIEVDGAPLFILDRAEKIAKKEQEKRRDDK